MPPQKVQPDASNHPTLQVQVLLGDAYILLFVNKTRLHVDHVAVSFTGLAHSLVLNCIFSRYFPIFLSKFSLGFEVHSHLMAQRHWGGTTVLLLLSAVFFACVCCAAVRLLASKSGVRRNFLRKKYLLRKKMTVSLLLRRILVRSLIG